MLHMMKNSINGLKLYGVFWFLFANFFLFTIRKKSIIYNVASSVSESMGKNSSQLFPAFITETHNSGS